MTKVSNRILALDNGRLRIPGCCEIMDKQLNYDCLDHGNSCPDVVAAKIKSGFLLCAGNHVFYTLNFCPWCGKNLSKLTAKKRKTK